jgi:hypothetical protein
MPAFTGYYSDKQEIKNKALSKQKAYYGNIRPNMVVS